MENNIFDLVEDLFSYEMSEFLEDKLNDRDALFIIAGACISLEVKSNMLKRLLRIAEDKEVISDINECLLHICRALDDIDQWSTDESRLIVCEECWYDPDDGSRIDNINRSRSIPPAMSFGELIISLLDDIEDNTGIRNFNAVDESWYELTLWHKVRNRRGNFVYEKGFYKYIMCGAKICFIEPSDIMGKIDRKSYEKWNCLAGSSDLNLPVPFKAGDIVTVDCRPFAPVEHMLIVDVSNNYDCCGLRGGFADKDGELHIDSVKHSHCFPNYYTSRVSPLYKMELSEGELYENETALRSVSIDMRRFDKDKRDLYGHILEEIKNGHI